MSDNSENQEPTITSLAPPCKLIDAQVKTVVRIDEIVLIPVNITVELKQFEGVKDGASYNFERYVTNIGEEEVSVPKTVISQVKVHLKENPNMEFFKVNKSGNGINTTYTVIPK